MEIEITETGDDRTFLVWYEIMKDVGLFMFTFSRVVWNEAKNALTFLGEGEAFTLYTAHHEDAKFTDAKPDGLRAVTALGRVAGISGKTTVEAIVESVNSVEGGHLIQCEKTDKGRLWSVEVVA